MIIGIDARIMYARGKASGIGRYIIEMVEALASLPGACRHEFVLFPGPGTVVLDLPPNWRYSGIKLSKKGMVRLFSYPFVSRKENLDVFYTADYLGPVLPMPCRNVVTVHDLIPVVYPEVTNISHRIAGRFFLPLSLRCADSVVAVSHATKRDILSVMDVEESKIRVIHEGAGKSFSPEADPGERARVFRKYSIPEVPYLFYLGSLDPKKNLFRILEAFDSPSVREKDCLMVLGGNIDTTDPELAGYLSRPGLAGRVVVAGFIDEDDLPVLFRSARGFCFPSLYEGFGLPLLEALACGCPVITSNVSSMPEVAGDAALMVNPGDVGEISRRMVDLITSDSLCEDLSEKALLQAGTFSWENAASRLLELFETE